MTKATNKNGAGPSTQTASKTHSRYTRERGTNHHEAATQKEVAIPQERKRLGNGS